MVKKEQVKTINILGEEYSIMFWDDQNFPKQVYDGFCDSLKKEIHIRMKKDIRLQDEVLRHEIIHAFLHESGLTEYENDEILVEWIAVQFPKMELAIKIGEKISPNKGDAIRI